MLPLAVVIPVAPGDTLWRDLVRDLSVLPPTCDIAIASPDPPPTALVEEARSRLACPLRWVTSPLGRAQQLNCAAAIARAPYLWFLHADTRLPPGTLPALARAIAARPEAFHYFDLRFADDGPPWVRLNAWGANLRSRWGGLPFGDQGFCLRRDLFERLGGFDEAVSCGEDHRLVWAARRAGVPLHPVGTAIVTSARKYRDRGWWQTTTRHLTLTLAQAWTETWRS